MNDLAEQEPARLQAMIARWFSEAGACNVLPLDDPLNRFVSSNPHSVAPRPRGVTQPGGGDLPPAPRSHLSPARSNTIYPCFQLQTVQPRPWTACLSRHRGHPRAEKA